MAKKKKWIQSAIKKPGALRRSLKAKKGKRIPAKRLTKATKSKNVTLKRRAVLAKTLRKLAAKRKKKRKR
jgi:hypothetical protein